MGEVKDAIKGTPAPKAGPPKTHQNLIGRISDMMDDVSHLTEVKTDDILKEAKSEQPENTRKAATLRAVYSLLQGARTLLEDY